MRPASPAAAGCAARRWGRLWPLLLLAPLAAHAQEAPEPGLQAAAPEFLDFLEYLGSWEGDDREWVQFLEEGEDEDDLTRDAVGQPEEAHEDDDDVVS